MLPLKSFENYIAENKLFIKSEKILLAVSGGKDSVLMARLFNASGLHFGIAHCNFNLRGEESLEDQQFTEGLAKELNAQFHLKSFDSLKYADEHKVSIQMAARELRYRWFEEIRQKFKYDYIALAHHQNDFVETILLNLVRGTGIAGLHGILPKRGHLIRPLLFLTRAEIDEVIVSEDIRYREDSSNLSSKYARNKIRLEVIPKLKAINPALEDTFKENSRRFSELEELLYIKVEELKAGLFEEYGEGGFRIELGKLKGVKPLKLLLYELFKPFSFSEPVLNSLIEAWDGQPGKIFESSTHRIILDRNALLLNSIRKEPEEMIEVAHYEANVNWKKFNFKISKQPIEQVQLEKEPSMAYFDAEFLKFPLRFRSWKNGDYFYPLGLKGKKKLSDYFTNLKVPLSEKSKVPILVNGNGDIMWVAGFRSDERYRVTPQTKKVIIFEIIS